MVRVLRLCSLFGGLFLLAGGAFAQDAEAESALPTTITRPDPITIPEDFPEAEDIPVETVAPAPATGPQPGGEAAPPPGPVLTFDFSTGLRRQDGRTTSRSALDFSYLTRTRTQSLELTLGTEFEAGGTDSGDETLFPDLGLAYALDTGVLLFSLTASYAVDDVDGILPADGFDEADLVQEDDGTRVTTGLTFSADLARRNAIGLELDGSYRRQEFRDIVDPNLIDSERLSFGTAVRFTVSPVLTFRLTGDHREFNGGGARATDETETSFGGRLTWQATPRTGVDLTLSQSRLRTSRDQIAPVFDPVSGAVIDLVSTGVREAVDRDALTGALTLTHEMPNGDIGFSATRDTTVNGALDRLSLSRSLSLAGGGDLRLALGAARFQSSDTVATASLNFVQPLPLGRFTASLSRDAAVDGNDQNVVRTRGSLGFQRPLTPLSDISVTLSRAEIDVINGLEDDQSSTSLSLSYSREFVRDWRINLSYQGSVQRQDNGIRTSDDLFSLRFNRRVTIRP